MNLKTNHLFFIFVTVFFVSSCATVKQPDFSKVTTIETTAFSDVEKTVLLINKKYGVENVLIVLDIDNTILTSTIDLGGDVWYQWQREKLAIKPSESQKVRCLFEDSIGLLYELGTMRLTEEHLPRTISAWQSQGNNVMALTSRAPKYRAATERELDRRNINLDISPLSPKGEKSPVYREVKGRELSYMKGIMMTSGMNKGEMLEYILDKTKRQFKAIIFVDDSQKNIDDLYKKYANHQSLDMRIFHYTRVEEKRKEVNGAVITQKQAKKMESDWNELNRALNKIFPARDLKDSCLSN